MIPIAILLGAYVAVCVYSLSLTIGVDAAHAVGQLRRARIRRRRSRLRLPGTRVVRYRR